MVEVVGLLGDNKGLVRVEAPLLLELGDVVLLEGSTVHIVATLLEGTETNGSLEVDDGGRVGGLLGLGNGSLDRIVVAYRQ